MINLSKRIRDFKKSRFVKDTATLQVSSVATRLLSILASVAFARILGADEFGVYALVFSLVALAELFMGIEGGGVVLILLPQAYARNDREEINNIISYFIKVNLLTSLIVGVMMIMIAPFIADSLYGASRIGDLARIVIFGAILTSFSSALTLCLQAIRKIKFLAVIQTLNRFLEILLPVTLVLFGLGLKGIVWGYFLNNIIFFIISVIVYSIWINKNKLLPRYHEIFSGLFKVKFKKYFSFGFLMLVDKKITALYSLLPLIILGIFVPPAMVGYFKLATKYVSLIGVFTKPIAELLMVQLPKSLADGVYIFKKNFNKVSFYTPILTLPIVLVTVALGSFFVNFFYGAEYRPVIPLIYFLAVGPFLNSAGIALGASVRVLNKMKESIFLNLLIIIIGLPFVYYLIRYLGVIGAIVVNLLWSFIATVAIFVLVERYLRQKLKIEDNL